MVAPVPGYTRPAVIRTGELVPTDSRRWDKREPQVALSCRPPRGSAESLREGSVPWTEMALIPQLLELRKSSDFRLPRPDFRSRQETCHRGTKHLQWTARQARHQCACAGTPTQEARKPRADLRRIGSSYHKGTKTPRKVRCTLEVQRTSETPGPSSPVVDLMGQMRRAA